MTAGSRVSDAEKNVHCLISKSIWSAVSVNAGVTAGGPFGGA